MAVSPTAPTPTPAPVVVAAAPAPTAGPHFALELQPPGVPVYEGEAWVGTITLLLNPTIVRGELPATVRTVCGSETRTRPGFQGSQPLTCVLPLGSHGVTVAAIMADGRLYTAATTAVITAPPVTVVTVYPVVISAAPGRTRVAFGVQTFDGARYRWDFGDGAHDWTLDAGTQHTYDARDGVRERPVVVTVTKDGRTLTTGTVVGIW